ncbi:MAG: cupin domain-containing protein [Desulfobacteraceae bacterium]|nr:MAG: cupin domain-containing protein [Desulfobacteraceae bacterium]
MSTIQKTNLFEQIAEASQESFHTLWENACVKIERIVSRGHSSPEEFWYDQAWDEWVLLLKGSAGLAFEGRQEVFLAPGDCLLIPAGVKHRVAWTDAGAETIWLAVHVYGDKAAPPNCNHHK